MPADCPGYCSFLTKTSIHDKCLKCNPVGLWMLSKPNVQSSKENKPTIALKKQKKSWHLNLPLQVLLHVWLSPCLCCVSGIHWERNYGTRSTRPIMVHEKTAICKSQLEPIIENQGNTQGGEVGGGGGGGGTSFWLLIRRWTIPGFRSSATQAISLFARPMKFYIDYYFELPTSLITGKHTYMKYTFICWFHVIDFKQQFCNYFIFFSSNVISLLLSLSQFLFCRSYNTSYEWEYFF